MIDTGTIATFIIVSFCFAFVLVLKRDTLPPGFRRGLALLAITMVGVSFFLVVYSFLHMGG